MWPFKKKPGLIRAQYLKDAGIDTNFEDAFRYSKGELKKHLGEFEQQEKMWNDQLSDLHTQKKVRDRKMERLTDEANNPDITEQAENDLMVQLTELEKQYLQDSKQTREAMASLREVEKTQWLLRNILDGTFSNPDRLANPPAEGWAGDWEDLFDGIPDAGRLDPERKNELRDRFKINKKSRGPEEEKQSSPGDEADPEV